MTTQPRRTPPCPHCYGRQVYYDALEEQWACLSCGWRAYPAEPLPYVRPPRTGAKRY